MGEDIRTRVTGRAADNFRRHIRGCATRQVTLASPRGIKEPGHAKIRRLMPRLFPDDANDYEKILRITDFVSGMTDSYAVTLYRRLSGHSIPR